MLMWNMPKRVRGLRLDIFSAPGFIMRPSACDGTTTIKSTTPLFGTLEGILFERQLRISYRHTPKTAGAGEKRSAGRPRPAARSNTRQPRAKIRNLPCDRSRCEPGPTWTGQSLALCGRGAEIRLPVNDWMFHLSDLVKKAG